MSNQGWSSTQTTPRLENVELQNLIPLIIPDDVLDKIEYLCQKIAKVEWSGLLFYQVEGSIKDSKNVKLVSKDILLMDKGSSAYTEYDWDEDIVEYRMNNPESMDWLVGHKCMCPILSN